MAGRLFEPWLAGPLALALLAFAAVVFAVMPPDRGLAWRPHQPEVGVLAVTRDVDVGQRLVESDLIVVPMNGSELHLAAGTSDIGAVLFVRPEDLVGRAAVAPLRRHEIVRAERVGIRVDEGRSVLGSALFRDIRR